MRGLLGGRSHSRFWVVVGSAWAGSAVSLPDMSVSPLLQPSGSLPSPVPAPLEPVGTLAPLRGLAAPAGVLRPPDWEPGSPRGCGAAAGTQVRLRKPLRAWGPGGFAVSVLTAPRFRRALVSSKSRFCSPSFAAFILFCYF